MTWFKVDDKLHSHRKARKAGPAAMGLWVLAGSWSADQLSNGFVPDYVAAAMDRDYRRHAAALVSAGLWEEDGENGDKGWRFHDWSEMQPTREDVEEKRESARERMRRVRSKGGRGSQDVRANTDGTSGEVRSTPTRPDPTIVPTELNTSSPIADATDDQARDDVEILCSQLADRIEGNGSKRPTVTKGWRTACRLMMDKDGRTQGQVSRMIDWCQADEFWRANILSMPTLREKYDRMRLRAMESSAKNQAPEPRSAPWTPEPPPFEIADDPEACDRWYRDQAAKREKAS